MSKNYLATVRANMPYPVEKQYRLEASSIAPVAGRAIKLFRKEKPGKKIEEITVKITHLK